VNNLYSGIGYNRAKEKARNIFLYGLMFIVVFTVMAVALGTTAHWGAFFILAIPVTVLFFVFRNVLRAVRWTNNKRDIEQNGQIATATVKSTKWIDIGRSRHDSRIVGQTIFYEFDDGETVRVENDSIRFDTVMHVRDAMRSDKAANGGQRITVAFNSKASIIISLDPFA